MKLTIDIPAEDAAALLADYAALQPHGAEDLPDLVALVVAQRAAKFRAQFPMWVARHQAAAVKDLLAREPVS